MCNEFHNRDAKPIPEDGIGYKIFTVIKTGGVLHPLMSLRLYRRKENDFAVWKDNSEDEGFCFFVTRKAAEETLPHFEHQRGRKVIRTILYKKAVNSKSFIERGMSANDPRIALCKRFKPIDGWKE
jgi:hypothetical protein